MHTHTHAHTPYKHTRHPQYTPYTSAHTTQAHTLHTLHTSAHTAQAHAHTHTHTHKHTLHKHTPYNTHLRALRDVPQPDGDVVAATEHVQLAGREACDVCWPLVGLELAQHAAAVGIKHLCVHACMCKRVCACVHGECACRRVGVYVWACGHLCACACLNINALAPLHALTGLEHDGPLETLSARHVCTHLDHAILAASHQQAAVRAEAA